MEENEKQKKLKERLKNTLCSRVTYMDLFDGAPQRSDYLFTNPPIQLEGRG